MTEFRDALAERIPPSDGTIRGLGCMVMGILDVVTQELGTENRNPHAVGIQSGLNEAYYLIETAAALVQQAGCGDL